MTGDNFYTNVSLIFIKEVLKFCHIIKHESILAELYFH